MDTKKTLICLFILSLFFVILLIIFLKVTILKNILPLLLPLLTTIFVAIVALISNQYGIYQNKLYESRLFTIKKRIEDLESLIVRLEKCHELFFELFGNYSALSLDKNIIEEILLNNLTPQILGDKFLEVIAISNKIGLLYWANYSILCNRTKELFGDLNNSISVDSLKDFWLEISSNKLVLQDQAGLNSLQQKYFDNFKKRSVDYLSSIMAYIYHLKEKKDNLLEELYSSNVKTS